MGGFAEGPLYEPMTIDLSRLEEKDFQRITELINEIKKPGKHTESITGDFYYEVKVCRDEWRKGVTVFKGESFRPHPKSILDIESIAEQQIFEI